MSHKIPRILCAEKNSLYKNTEYEMHRYSPERLTCETKFKPNKRNINGIKPYENEFCHSNLQWKKAAVTCTMYFSETTELPAATGRTDAATFFFPNGSFSKDDFYHVCFPDTDINATGTDKQKVAYTYSKETLSSSCFWIPNDCIT